MPYPKDVEAYPDFFQDLAPALARLTSRITFGPLPRKRAQRLRFEFLAFRRAHYHTITLLETKLTKLRGGAAKTLQSDLARLSRNLSVRLLAFEDQLKTLRQWETTVEPILGDMDSDSCYLHFTPKAARFTDVNEQLTALRESVGNPSRFIVREHELRSSPKLNTIPAATQQETELQSSVLSDVMGFDDYDPNAPLQVPDTKCTCEIDEYEARIDNPNCLIHHPRDIQGNVILDDLLPSQHDSDTPSGEQ